MVVANKAANPLSGYKADDAPASLPPNWDDIRIFVAVARCGSYRRAARELTMTQPAISNRITRIEIALGAKLFNRTPKGIDLTIEGRHLLNHASAAELSLTRAFAVVRTTTDKAEGECKIGVGDGLGGAWIPQFLPGFYRQHPNIKLNVFTTNDRAVNKRPLFDIQIQYQAPMEPDLVGVPLGELHFTLFASRSYIDKHGMPLSRDDLMNHRLVDLSLALTEKGTLSFWAGLSDRAMFFTNSSVTLAEAVWSGAGIGLLPTYAAAIDPGLVAVLPQLRFRSAVFACFERGAGKRPAVRATINFLKEHVFNRQTMPWFAEEFHNPEPVWRERLNVQLAALDELDSLIPRATAQATFQAKSV
jgi:DNA-binding transcriptional LysR family regulator